MPSQLPTQTPTLTTSKSSFILLNENVLILVIVCLIIVVVCSCLIIFYLTVKLRSKSKSKSKLGLQPRQDVSGSVNVIPNQHSNANRIENDENSEAKDLLSSIEPGAQPSQVEIVARQQAVEVDDAVSDQDSLSSMYNQINAGVNTLTTKHDTEMQHLQNSHGI